MTTRIEYGSIVEQLITNLDDFELLTREFDETHGSTTGYAEMTMQEIWDHFLAPDDKNLRYWANSMEDYVHRILRQRVTSGFADRNSFWSNDATADEPCMGKLNALDMMRQDIKSGKGFVHPISVLALPNGSTPVHPGQTRMMWYAHYTETVPVIVTEMPGAPRFKDLRLISEMPDVFEGENLSFKTGMTDDPNMPAHFNKAANIDEEIHVAYFVKEVTDYFPRDDAEPYTYHQPREAWPPRFFEKRDNEIYIDESLIAVLDGDEPRWRLVL